MPCGAVLSRERRSAHAVREAVRAAGERAGGAVTSVLVFASGEHTDAPEMALAAGEAAPGAALVGAVSSGVVAEGVEVEDGPGVAALAFGSGAPAARSFWLGDEPPAERLAAGAVVVLADGSGGSPEAQLTRLGRAVPEGTPIVGAVAAAGVAGAPLPRFLDQSIAMSRPAGLLLGRPGEVVVGHAQGCLPVGPHLTVTATRGNVVERLDGRPAFEVFAERARPLLETADLARAAQTIFLALDEGRDLLVRGIMAFDPDQGLLAVSTPLPVGTRLRFALRDGQAARASLRDMLDDVKRRLEGRRPRLGLWLASAGRGRALFGVPDHDVAFLQDALGPIPLIGLFGGSEIARGKLHIFSGVLVLA
jgi:small ligand-binding sensory domain FIST